MLRTFHSFRQLHVHYFKKAGLRGRGAFKKSYSLICIISWFPLLNITIKFIIVSLYKPYLMTVWPKRITVESGSKIMAGCHPKQRLLSSLAKGS